MKYLEKLFNLAKWQVGSARNSMWIDSNGMVVERHRVKKSEAANEKATKSIFVEAIKLSKQLHKLRVKIDKAMKHCYVVFLTEEGEVIPTDENGNMMPMPGFTVHNFSRTVKVVREAKNLTVWNPNYMQIALERFEEFFDSNIQMFKEGKMSVMRDMILATFKDRGGRFDSRQVHDVLKYRAHPAVKDDEIFQSAIAAIDSAKEKGSCIYYDRIYVWSNGKWEEVQLNFSKIDPDDGEGEEG